MNAGPLAIFGHTLYAGTDKGVYSLQRDGSWQLVGPSSDLLKGYAASADVLMLADIHGVLYAGTEWGVYSYKNGVSR
ncbi:MAG: hypothetical protein ACYCVB_06230 [Bacilli bacterium]